MGRSKDVLFDIHSPACRSGHLAPTYEPTPISKGEIERLKSMGALMYRHKTMQALKKKAPCGTHQFRVDSLFFCTQGGSDIPPGCDIRSKRCRRLHLYQPVCHCMAMFLDYTLDTSIYFRNESDSGKEATSVIARRLNRHDTSAWLKDLG